LFFQNPSPEESLADVWKRVQQWETWVAARRSCGDFDDSPCASGMPFFKWEWQTQKSIIDCFHQHIVPTLPGVDGGDKLQRVFAQMPPWLVWSTFMDVLMAIPGLAVPDVSEFYPYARDLYGRRVILHGPFEKRLRADGSLDEFADWACGIDGESARLERFLRIEKSLVPSALEELAFEGQKEWIIDWIEAAPYYRAIIGPDGRSRYKKNNFDLNRMPRIARQLVLDVNIEEYPPLVRRVIEDYRRNPRKSEEGKS
jgi:hypothetical protein